MPELKDTWVKQSQMSIDLTISGDLAERLQELLSTGCFSSKPEVIREALRHLFADLDEIELQRRRLKMLG